MVNDAGHGSWVLVDSCGTGSWHVGEAPDRRATIEASARGYRLDQLRARQFNSSDFQAFDYILAMDRSNLRDLSAMKPAGFGGHLGLFLDFHPDIAIDEVPDPYYGGDEGFAHVLDLVEEASRGLMRAMLDAR
jgi:protein-tyrosine phosphatase